MQHCNGNRPHKDAILIKDRLCLLSAAHFPNYLLSSWGGLPQAMQRSFQASFEPYLLYRVLTPNQFLSGLTFPKFQCLMTANRIYINTKILHIFSAIRKKKPIIKEYRENSMFSNSDFFFLRNMKTRQHREEF